MISTKSLKELLATLLHEAAHTLAYARGICDTTRQGRYHTRRFAALADELGLEIVQPRDPVTGWNRTTVPKATVAVYHAEVDTLAAAITTTDTPIPPVQAGPRGSSNNGLALLCGSPARSVSAFPSVAGLGPSLCTVCGQPFAQSRP
jgi:hypothetical protein